MRRRLWYAHLIWLTLCVGVFCFSEWVTGKGLLPQFIEISAASSLQRFKGAFRDLKLRARGQRKPTQKIVILDIDDASIYTIGRWPWRRDYLADLHNAAFAMGASVVIQDILFPDAQESMPEEVREALQQCRPDMPAQFDFDKTLSNVFNVHRKRLVPAWAAQAACQPAFSTMEECPVSDRQYIEEIPSYFTRFALKDVQIDPGFSRAQTPLTSVVSPLTNLPQFDAASDQVGIVQRSPDVDGLVRRTPAVVMMDGKLYPSLALAAAQLIRNDTVQVSIGKHNQVAGMRWSKTGETIPVDDRGLFNLNLLAGKYAFEYVSAVDLLNAFMEKMKTGQAGQRDLASESGVGRVAEKLKDAYVFVGISALAVGDLIATTFEPAVPGVELHATALENILSDSLIRTGRAGPLFAILLAFMVLFGLLGVVVGQRWEAVPAIAFCFAVFALSAFIDIRLLFPSNIDLPTGFWYLQMAGTLTITLVGRYIIEQNDKKFLRGAFAKYVAPAVVDSIVKDPKQLSLGGRRETLTIMFSDVRGFTTLSEKLDAHTISEFLNDFLGMQTEIVFQHGGTLDKYIGDAVMAFWGAPLSLSDHASRGCQAAIAIANALAENRPRYLEKYGIHVHMGIGVHTGEVSVGNMGSARSFSYTVIGDNVNLASRLEGATKQFGVEILTTRATLEAIGQSGQALPPYRSLAQTRVKGKKNAVELIEVIRDPKNPAAVEAFQQGVELYRKRQWTAAIEKFTFAKQGLKSEKEDLCSDRYLELCRQYAEQAPDADWDGSWSLTDK